MDSTVAASGQNLIDLTTEITAVEKKGLTVVRQIVDLTVSALTAGTGGRFFSAMMVMESDAFAAGAAPDLEVQGEDPGFLWRRVDTVFTDVLNVRANSTLIRLDNRGMRKLPGEDVVLVLVLRQLASGISMNVDGLIRTLWMRP